MNGYRPTRAACWLGTWLAEGGDFVTSIVRNGARLGFSEGVIRGAFAEIRATAAPGGQQWTLDKPGAQFFRDWAAAHGAPRFTAGQECAYLEFWTKFAASPSSSPTTAAPSSGAVDTKKAATPVRDPKDDPIYKAFAKMSADIKAQRLAREAAQQAEPKRPVHSIDTAAIYARRRQGAR